MKFDVTVHRNEIRGHTFTVKAEDKAQAEQEGLEESYDHDFLTDSHVDWMDYKVQHIEPVKVAEEKEEEEEDLRPVIVRDKNGEPVRCGDWVSLYTGNWNRRCNYIYGTLKYDPDLWAYAVYVDEGPLGDEPVMLSEELDTQVDLGYGEYGWEELELIDKAE